MDQLESFGIPRSRLPVDIGGDLRLDFEQFIADYSVLESLNHMDSEEKKSKTPVARTNSSTADEMITADDLKKAASGMGVMSPPPFTENSEADIARTKILSNFSSQLLKASSLASSKSSSSVESTGNGSSSKPRALLATQTLPVDTNAAANPWSIEPISSSLDLDSFEFDLDEIKNVGAS